MNRAERLVPWAILGALSLFVLLYLLFLVVPLPAINAVECTDDHRGDYEAPPAVQVDVHTD